jgi:hypothetical protein
VAIGSIQESEVVCDVVVPSILYSVAMADDARRTLYCLVKCENVVLKVTAFVDNDIADLKKLVKQEKKNGTLRDADAANLVLFKVSMSVEVSTNPAAHYSHKRIRRTWPSGTGSVGTDLEGENKVKMVIVRARPYEKRSSSQLHVVTWLVDSSPAPLHTHHMALEMSSRC